VTAISWDSLTPPMAGEAAYWRDRALRAEQANNGQHPSATPNVEGVGSLNDLIVDTLVSTLPDSKAISDHQSPGYRCVELYAGPGSGYRTIRTLAVARAIHGATRERRPFSAELLERAAKIIHPAAWKTGDGRPGGELVRASQRRRAFARAQCILEAIEAPSGVPR
jgi:hypothetical protein